LRIKCPIDFDVCKQSRCGGIFPVPLAHQCPIDFDVRKQSACGGVFAADRAHQKNRNSAPGLGKRTSMPRGDREQSLNAQIRAT
jgi:hypothetical protein